MSKQPRSILDQALGLVDAARLLPVDDAARVLEQVVTMAQAAQAEVLVAAERSGELKDSGCATVRTFATSVLRRGVNDSAAFAQTAHRLSDFPHLAEAYRAGRVHTGNLRVVFRSVKIVRVGDLARLDAMLDPVVADQLKATLAAMTKAARHAEKQAEQSRPNGADGDDVWHADRAVVDPRTHGERSADALEEILRRGMDASLRHSPFVVVEPGRSDRPGPAGVPLCGSHHRRLHEGGFTVTRQDDALVFRDPCGRPIANLHHILATELDLLGQRARTGAAEGDPDPPGRAQEFFDDVGGWPASPYRHGHWGWSGQNPTPPPGHAPPQPA